VAVLIAAAGGLWEVRASDIIKMRLRRSEKQPQDTLTCENEGVNGLVFVIVKPKQSISRMRSYPLKKSLKITGPPPSLE
jgi:hypothetical protein